MRQLQNFLWALTAVVVLTLAVYLTISITRWINRSANLHLADTANVVRQIQTLSDLVTVKYVVEKVVILDAPPESTLGQFVQGDNRVLLLAHGIIKGGHQPQESGAPATWQFPIKPSGFICRPLRSWMRISTITRPR